MAAQFNQARAARNIMLRTTGHALEAECRNGRVGAEHPAAKRKPTRNSLETIRRAQSGIGADVCTPEK
jgi:hypothetical protein